MMYLLIKQIIFTLQCLSTIWSNMVTIIQIHQEVYGSKRDEVSANNADLATNNSKSFRYKAALEGKQQTLLMEIAS